MNPAGENSPSAQDRSQGSPGPDGQADDQNHNNSVDKEMNELLEMVDQLEEHRKICQKSKNFMEADEAKQRIKDLKFQIVIKRRKELEIRHSEEINNIIASQEDEMQKFEGFWIKKLEDYEAEAHSIEEQMIEKHKQDVVDVDGDLRRTLPIRPKTTPQHLNYKKVLDNLAKQGEYAEAHKLKVICEGLEKQEIDKAKEERENKIKYILNQLLTKQQSELRVLRKRIEAGRSELAKARQMELEKLLHKFQNIRQEIELVQQLEVSKFEMAYRNYVPSDKSVFNSPQKKPGSKFVALNNSIAQYSNASIGYGARVGNHKRSNTGLSKSRNNSRFGGAQRGSSQSRVK